MRPDMGGVEAAMTNVRGRGRGVSDYGGLDSDGGCDGGGDGGD